MKAAGHSAHHVWRDSSGAKNVSRPSGMLQASTLASVYSLIGISLLPARLVCRLLELVPVRRLVFLPPAGEKRFRITEAKTSFACLIA